MTILIILEVYAENLAEDLIFLVNIELRRYDGMCNYLIDSVRDIYRYLERNIRNILRIPSARY